MRVYKHSRCGHANANVGEYVHKQEQPSNKNTIDAIIHSVFLSPAGTSTTRSVEDAFAYKKPFKSAALFAAAATSEESPAMAPNIVMGAHVAHASNAAKAASLTNISQMDYPGGK